MPEIKHIWKSFGNKQVICDFSLQFESGEHICITGPSGSGKTTLLRIICGLEKADRGELQLPTNVFFSMVFQEDRLIEGMSAEDNVALVCSASMEVIRKELMNMGIVETTSPVSTFSGGMKRRVALCRAMLAPSTVVLLDEPYKGLDDDTRASVIRECERLMQEKTVFMVTHDIEEAQGWRHIKLNKYE